MTQRIKYKVISFSSEQREYPASSLLVPGTDGWQTKRFCNYPQEVTIEFYGVVHLDKIELLADTRKIASSVDVLYYDPTQSATESKFVKYGSLEFSRNESGKIHEQKTVMVDMKCLYLRFLFHRPYKNKQNFFSQVHIHQLLVYGGQSNIMFPLDTSIGKKHAHVDPKAITEEEDELVYEKLVQIQNLKERAVMEENFDEAERLKQVMMNVKKFGYSLKGLKQKKQEAANNEDYEQAKNIKQQIDRVKRQVEILVTSAIEGDDDEEMEEDPEMEHDVQGNQFVGLEMDKMLQGNSRISQKSSRVKNLSRSKKKHTQSPYDERIIPTLQNKVKTEQAENPPQQNQMLELPLAEQVQGNYASDALAMQQFFEEETIRQFYSKKWQLKEKALTDILGEISKKPQDASLIKCLLRCVSHSIVDTNFKISQLCLNLLRETLKINGKVHKISRSNSQVLRDLQCIIEEIIKKMSDNNQKTRTLSEQSFYQMVDSSLYGVEVCCTALMRQNKSSAKLSIKQEAHRLNSLTTLISKYGLGQNGAPLSVVEYAVEKLSNPASEVRNQAVNLLAVCANKDSKLIQSQLEGKKAIYIQQIESRQKQLANGSVNQAATKKK